MQKKGFEGVNTNISELGTSDCETPRGAAGDAAGLGHVCIPKRDTSKSTTLGTLSDTAEVCPSGGNRLSRVLEPRSGLRGARGLRASTITVPRRVAAGERGNWSGDTDVLVDQLTSELARIRLVVVLGSRECGAVHRVAGGVRAVADELLE